jgi:plasmid maintenance system antidote protein VapI
MDKNKHAEIAKSLIESKKVTKFTDLLGYLPKYAISDGMGIHKNSLKARMEDLGTITLDNLLNLEESFGIDPLIIVTLAANERLQQRKKKSKK